jgi:hypothetical protein
LLFTPRLQKCVQLPNTKRNAKDFVILTLFPPKRMRLDQFSLFSLLSVLHRTPEKLFLTGKNEKNRKDETKIGKIYI